MIKFINCILIAGFAVLVMKPMTVSATTISEVQQSINQHQNEINQYNQEIENLTAEQDLVEEKISDITAEIVNTMTDIGLKEDEISAKETELSEKQVQIDKTQEEYEAAKEREEKQYADMVIRLRMMYENDETTYLSHILEGKGLGDILNRMDFIEGIYAYDRLKLQEFEATKQEVHDLWDRLEEEKKQLETEKAQLETDKQELESQKTQLDGLLAKRKQESANYAAEIAKAKQDAAVAKKLLQQEQQKLKQLQAAQKKPGNSAATSGKYTATSYTDIIEDADGSTLGKNVAKYGCQFIGNPYVMGGTSLTKGADCSGFTYRIYSDFGYSIPRTSYAQRSAGEGVSYSDAEPGDLICYDGHVGLYIGGGKIVHASSARTGIKVSNANYRTILAVRRIIE